MHNEQNGTPSDSRGSNNSTARAAAGYPLGRGYGHDYMRGGEVFGGYGYSDRPEYEKTRGERGETGSS
jgi:hypothetical protein